MSRSIVLTALLGASTLGVMAAYAATPGPYVTGQLGYAKTDPKLNLGQTTVISSKDNGELAGRLAIGYQIDQNFALESGYLYLGKQTHNLTGPNGLTGSYSLNNSAIDLLGKSVLPLANNFNVYGKLGVAYLTRDLKGQTTSQGRTTRIDTRTAGIAAHQFAPEAAVGVSYDLAPNVSVDVSLTHIQTIGKNRGGNLDFAALGLGYSFG